MAKKREPSMAEYAAKRQPAITPARAAKPAAKDSTDKEGGTGRPKAGKHSGKVKKPKKSAKARMATPGVTVGMGMSYEPKYDLDTLTRAEEIKRDKKRHAAAQNEAKQQQQRLASVTAEKTKSRARPGA